MYKLLGISYSRDGRKLFTILDTSDGVKEKLTLEQVQKARLIGLKIENLTKSLIYPLKTKEELHSYWSGLRPDYIDSIAHIIENESKNIKFPCKCRIYVNCWDNSMWFDCGIPHYLEVRCDSVIELVSHWMYFCNKCLISHDSIDKIIAC